MGCCDGREDHSQVSAETATRQIDALYLSEAAAREDMEILNSMDLKDTQTVQELAEAQTRYHKMAL